MKLTYIFHSGFALETDDAVLIFDYWMDPARVVPNATKQTYGWAKERNGAINICTS